MKLASVFVPALLAASVLAQAGCASGAATAPAADTAAVVGSPADYDALLKKYVKGDFVEYAAWSADKADMARFDAFLR